MPPEDTNLLTTGQAAKYCSVTPDTILKWIKKGRLQGVRTAGGHYRVERRDLETLIPTPHSATSPLPPPAERCSEALPCWEYLGDRGVVRDHCQQCVVYRVRAARCFLMAGMDQDVGHVRQFCQNSCEDCVYYRHVNGLAANVLVVTSDDDLIDQLAGEDNESVNLRFARNGYEASAVIHDFRPAFVVIDTEDVSGGETELLDHLTSDPRVPGLRAILLVPTKITGRWRRRSESESVVGILKKPLEAGQIAQTVTKCRPVGSPVRESGNPLSTDKRGVTMSEEKTLQPDSTFDEDGFLRTLSNWSRSMAESLAVKNDIGPLTEEHWRVIEFVKDYYEAHGTGPPVVKIGKKTGMNTDEICGLFPCGVVRGVYRLAGLPRPPGCF
jgi:dissimilatory sulfite reductase related protein